MNNVRLPFALDQHGRVVSIHEVANGLACNCNCPGCGAQLVAKQGNSRAWYFAHHSVEPCVSGYESALHLAAKQLIADASMLLLPPCWIYRYPAGTPALDETIDDYCYFGGRPSSGYVARWREAHAGFANVNAASVRFGRVELESALGDIRPDLIGYCGERRLLIEIAVTHKVDAIKLAKIRALGLPAIEITLPQDGNPLDWSKLSDHILNSVSGKHWLYHPRLEAEVDVRLAIALQRRDAEANKRAAREEHYRTHYAPTHHVQFYLHGFRNTARVHLRLCPSHVSVGIWPGEAKAVLAVTRTALSAISEARYDQRRRQWILPATMEWFLELAQRLHAQGFSLCSCRVPPCDEHKVMSASGFRPAPTWAEKAERLAGLCADLGLEQAASNFLEASKLFFNANDAYKAGGERYATGWDQLIQRFPSGNAPERERARELIK